MTASTSEPPETFQSAAAYTDIPAGWIRHISLGQAQLALANIEGTIYAFDHHCPHAHGPLGDNRLTDNCLVECRWHGARFNIRSGEVETGPARRPPTRYPVRVINGTVFVNTNTTTSRQQQPPTDIGTPTHGRTET
jgi:nitrite reductase/ring-hydroxylating ferredoxin subunit